MKHNIELHVLNFSAWVNAFHDEWFQVFHMSYYIVNVNRQPHRYTSFKKHIEPISDVTKFYNKCVSLFLFKLQTTTDFTQMFPLESFIFEKSHIDKDILQEIKILCCANLLVLSKNYFKLSQQVFIL